MPEWKGMGLWGVGGSDLDEGHCAPGLCDAGAQRVHVVLHGTQDFGLFGLWMTTLMSMGSGRGHSLVLGSQVSPRRRGGVT